MPLTLAWGLVILGSALGFARFLWGLLDNGFPLTTKSLAGQMAKEEQRSDLGKTILSLLATLVFVAGVLFFGHAYLSFVVILLFVRIWAYRFS